MDVIENKDERIVLRLDIKDTLANALRRSLSEIPTLAIDDVEIFKNDSALYDEMLAHRLGLIPLKTSEKVNEKTTVDFKLTKKGPGNVYSEDLEGNGEVVFGKIPITLLGENHRIELLATARTGIGLEHAKYLPGLCYYRNIIEVKSSPNTDKIVENSKGLIKAEKKGQKWICDLNEAEIDEITEKDKDAVSDTNEILFVIESFGQMPAKTIFKKAIEVLEKDLDSFEKEIK